MFPTRYKNKTRVKNCSCIGTREHTLFAVETKSNGEIVLSPKGKKDLYAEIQSHRDSVDIHILMKRFEAGDMSALNQSPGFYIDCSNMPRNLADVLKIINNARAEFDSLPLKIREEYGYDVNKFIADIGSNHWNSLFSAPTQSAIQNDEVNSKSEVKSENVEQKSV